MFECDERYRVVETLIETVIIDRFGIVRTSSVLPAHWASHQVFPERYIDHLIIMTRGAFKAWELQFDWSQSSHRRKTTVDIVREIE